MDDLKRRVQVASLLIVLTYVIIAVYAVGEAREPYLYKPLPVDRFSAVVVPRATVIPPIYEPIRRPERSAPQRIQPPAPVRVIAAPSTPGTSGSSIRGTASWYRSHCDCNAMTDQRWRGQRVRVVGPIGHADVVINDAGPVPSLRRVADLEYNVFKAVCGSPEILGLCTVTISLL